MSKVDWNTMTGPQIWAALESAPKIVGPWEIAGRGSVRRSIDGRVVGASGGILIGEIHTDGAFENTREDADAKLRANGWRFADEPEYGVWLETDPRWRAGSLPHERWLEHRATCGLVECEECRKTIGVPSRFTKPEAERIAVEFNSAKGSITRAGARELPPLKVDP